MIQLAEVELKPVCTVCGELIGFPIAAIIIDTDIMHRACCYPPITREQALTAHTFHHNTVKNADGTCQRWRRNGATQTWKTRPAEYRVPVKHGLKNYSNITEREANLVHTAEECRHGR